MHKLILTAFMLGTAIYLNAQCTENGNYWNESWVSCTSSTNPNPVRGNSKWLLYEFGETQFIDTILIWNANRTGESGWGAKEVMIDYSTDGTNWITFGNTPFHKPMKAQLIPVL